jgi:Na+-transporting methylmalonyl-CoA/oxaloacetate decarboxylase gamma subunit
MSPIELYILGLGVVAIVCFVLALCWLVSKLEALTWRVATTEDLLEQLVGKRVDEALTEGCRSLNEVRS